MTTRRAAIASALVLALSASLTARAEDPKIEGDLKTLQGDWVSKDDQGNESKWTFKGDKLSLKAHPDREYTITIKLDDKAKPEKTIEFAVSEDSKNAKGFKAPGIYKFDGEKKVSICFGADGKDRPKEFKTDMQTQFSFDLTKK
jgi:uncharacterized protein (TIGR03067 family)